MGGLIPFGDASRQPKRFPLVTTAIIVVNALVFLLELNGGDAFVSQWSVIPADIVAGRNWINIITAMFMHAGWLHTSATLPSRSDPDAAAVRLLLPRDRDSRGGAHRVLVRHTAVQSARLHGECAERRHRVPRPCRRLHLRSGNRADLRGFSADRRIGSVNYVTRL